MNAALVSVAVLLLASPAAPGAPDRSPSASTQAAVTVPDTPAGRGLQGFVSSFNEGGDKRRDWLATATTMEAGNASNLFEQDVQLLQQIGPMTIVRVQEKSATATSIVAIVHHAKGGMHGHLTIEVEAEAPHKVSNIELRAATPEEIKGI